MKKTLLTIFMAAMAAVGSWADTGTATVKMTYVDYDNADTYYGEIAAGETAISGYNKISGGSIAFVNTGWKANKIAYLQVDASVLPGTITGATLTAEVSGSTDNKRTTGWGVGYNSSTWSGTMTYNTADKTITKIGAEAWTATKSSKTFETKTFDITDAFIGDEDKVVTLLVYELAAAGGYIKNPTVSVNYSTASTAEYTVKYILNGTGTEVKASQTAIGASGEYYTVSDEDKAACYAEGNSMKYIYESDNASDKAIAEDGSTVITVTFREAAKYSYTAKSNVGTYSVTGEVWEGDNATVAFPKYQLVDGNLYIKAANGVDYFHQTFAVVSDNHTETFTYTQNAENIIYYKEAEEIDGMTASASSNANIRCSNALGGYNAGSEAVKVITLPVGSYKIYTMVWGNAGTDLLFNIAGEEL